MDNNGALGFMFSVMSGCVCVCVPNTIRALCDMMGTNGLTDGGTLSGRVSEWMWISMGDTRNTSRTN